MEQIKVSICVDCLETDAGYETDNALAMVHLRGYLIGPDYDIHDDHVMAMHSDGYFSWGMCDGCGSNLGGQRWDMVAVKKEG